MAKSALPDTPERGENPFIYNEPVRSEDFIGRREIIKRVLNETVLRKTQASVWLTGEKGMGKTSLLKYLHAYGESFDKKINLYGMEGDFNVAFIYVNLEFSSDFFSSLNRSLENYFDREFTKNVIDYHTFLDSLRHLFFEEKYYIVFLLDEFDVFFRKKTWSAHNPGDAEYFMTEINKLLQGISVFPGEPKAFGCVFASQLTFKELLENLSISLDGSGIIVEPMEMSLFSKAETAQLAERYLKDNPIGFSKEDAELCFKLTQGYPLFTQRMYSVIYEQKVSGAAGYLRKAQQDYAISLKETAKSWGFPEMKGNKRAQEILSSLFQAISEVPPQALQDDVRKEPPTSQQHADFYLSSVSLGNILGFESLSAQLESEEGLPLMFFLLLGDNSSGKSSFLRCLALGMCDKISAAVLLADYQGKFVHNGCKEGTITLDLTLSGKKRYRIVTRVKQVKHLEDVEKEYYELPKKGKAKLIPAEDFPWDDLFVCGYGAGRALGETREKYEAYRVKNAVGTLFRYDQPLQDPELSLRRVVSQARHIAPQHLKLETEEKILRDLLGLINKLFMLTGDEHIDLTGKGMELVTEESRSVLRAHGDGYKSTSGWVLDLIAWNMLAGRSLTPPDMSGIVLIDEIEQHLHPKWQRYIIQLLCELFPGIQFIVATHSPLCTSGITDLEEDKYQVLRFHKTGDEPADVVRVASLRGLRADQILTSEAFDLPATCNPEIAEKLERFSFLYLKEPRTAEEEQEFHELGQLLKEIIPGTADTLETRLMVERVKNVLKNSQKTPDQNKKAYD